MFASQRLTHLLELAHQGPALRAALAEEVAELLTDWPADCPAEMRGACEALLARAACEVSEDIRARLRVRLYADPQLSQRVLPREDQDRALIDAARAGDGLAPRIARALGLSDIQAQDILRDPTGHALAVACKGLGLGRIAFSTLAVLSAPPGDAARAYARLEAFDAVPAAEAARQLRAWRGESIAA